MQSDCIMAWETDLRQNEAYTSGLLLVTFCLLKDFDSNLSQMTPNWIKILKSFMIGGDCEGANDHQFITCSSCIFSIRSFHFRPHVNFYQKTASNMSIVNFFLLYLV